jgi:K+-sensing histidine kinase KdpD
MMDEQPERIPARLSYEELYQQNLALQRELAELRTSWQSVWALLVDASRRLQVSSASIKAAVSSLLNYDIFWDGANQHEFLTTINTSVDQAAKLVALLALTLRTEEGSLELKPEPHNLQEIISIVQDRSALAFPKLMLAIALPAEGRPVLVDYEYLITALELLCEVFEVVAGLEYLQVQATENEDNWFLDFRELDPAIVQSILSPLDWQTDRLAGTQTLPLDYLLRLYVVRQILRLQNIDVEILDSATGKAALRLRVPIAVTESITHLTQPSA